MAILQPVLRGSRGTADRGQVTLSRSRARGALHVAVATKSITT